MAYSNDNYEIRSGLVNYIGALLRTAPFEGKAGKQTVAAVLTEETLKLAKDEDGVFDLFVLKPMLRGTAILLKQRVAELSKLPGSEQVASRIEEYQTIIVLIESLVAMVQ